jgi:hypothetical protein
MSTQNDLEALNGLFKESYADKLEMLQPDGVKLLKKVKFVPAAKQNGNFYNAPVVLGLEHGVTFASDDAGAFNLNAPVAGQIKNARLRGSQLVLRSVMPYVSVSRSEKNAFEQATKYLVQNMLRSVSKKLEIEMLYGQEGYATVASTNGNDIAITTAEWAAGIWAGSEKMPIEIRSAAGVLRGETIVKKAKMDSKTIEVEAMPAGVQATDIIWHKGAFGKEFAGIHKIISNNGVLFDIDAAEYSLWQGNVEDLSGAALEFDKLDRSIVRAIEKGLESNVVVMVNNRTWSDLMTEQAAKRSYDHSYSRTQFDNGANSIVFHSQAGKMEIVPSIYVKEGYAYILNMEDFLRVGSTDVTFKRPGKGDDFFRDLENAAGYELRCYTDQALFCQAPGRQVLIKGIVNGV